MDITLKAAQKDPKNLYTLGPLIHNPQAVKFLEQSGVEVKSRVENIPKGRVIFRSHGVSLGDLVKAREKRLHIIDATCPIVKRAKFFAKYLYRHGYMVLIVGDPHHPEVEAIQSYIKDRVVTVGDVDEVRRLGPWQKLGIIAQTTQSFNIFKEIVTASLEKAKEVRVFNTICHAAIIRQKEAMEIAKKVECMIVIGGYKSGNTQRLVTICREIQPNTYHIETAQALHPRWLVGREKIGLTAGASTPLWIIQEVEGRIRDLKGRCN
jgi:4-hydroxy-3-methylbut-2-enyl diphosphate reductase